MIINTEEKVKLENPAQLRLLTPVTEKPQGSKQLARFLTPQREMPLRAGGSQTFLIQKSSMATNKDNATPLPAKKINPREEQPRSRSTVSLRIVLPSKPNK